MVVFQKEEVVKTNELERDVNGLIQRDTRKKFYKDRSAKIEHYSLLLRDEKINVKRFLKIMANVDNKIVFLESDFPMLDIDEIDFENTNDKELFSDILKNLNENSAADPNSPTVSIEPSTSTLEQPQTKSQPPVLTRSKARKATQQKDHPSSSLLTTPSRKRRVVNESEESQFGIGSKRSKVIE